MSKKEISYGHSGSQCYVWWRYDDGSMEIWNNEMNALYTDNGGYVHDNAGNIVSVSGSGAILTGGAGNDRIENDASVVTINGAAGNDRIINRGKNVTINGGAGDDYVSNERYWSLGLNPSNVLIRGDEGDDRIINYSNKVTVNGGADDDFINNIGSANFVVEYTEGDGNDLI